MIRTLPCFVMLAVLAACGQKIGDSCSIASDCASDGTRVCDTFSSGGYCTIQGCDFGTCPSEAECVRFFPTIYGHSTCTDTSQCSAGEECTDAGLCITSDATCSTKKPCASDEFCTVAGACAPRAIEVRFCMLKCSSSGDCRDGYECRNLELMQQHGGEPVPDPNNANAGVPTQGFCAPLRSCATDADCATDEQCSFDLRVCVPRTS